MIPLPNQRLCLQGPPERAGCLLDLSFSKTQL